MDGVSSTLGVMDSDERMVNELEKDGSGEDAVMVCDELKDMEGDWVHVEELEEPEPDIVEVEELAGDCVRLSEEEALIVEDQEGPAVGDMVLDQEG